MRVNEEKITELVESFRTAPTKEKEEELMLYARDLVVIGARKSDMHVMAVTADWFQERFGEPLGAIFAHARFTAETHPKFESIAKVGRNAAYRRDVYPFFEYQKDLALESEGWDSTNLSKGDIYKIKKILGRAPSEWEMNIAHEALAQERLEIARGNR